MQRNVPWCKREQQSAGGSPQESLALLSKSISVCENTKATVQLCCLRQASLGALSGAKQAGHKPEGGESGLVHGAAPL